MAKKKKGLIEQLKALIGLDKEPELMGAMCYETHMPRTIELTTIYVYIFTLIT